MRKKARQHALLGMIDSSGIMSQAELADLLTAEGFKVTQASVSRDLDELGITKVAGRYVRQRDPNREAEFQSVSFDTAGDNLIVGRCSSGLASAVTVRIDRAGIAEIVGTIAGDDTIFIAVKSADDQEKAFQRLTGLFEVRYQG